MPSLTSVLYIINMPTSHPKIISPIAEKILQLQPKSILDIGIGFGKWGSLAREYTDIWSWRFYKNEWIVKIDGIEIHEKYKAPNWGNYNNIYIGHSNSVLPKLGTYEVIIMMEMLEHLQKPDALGLLTEIFKHTKKLIVSYSNTPQKNVRDNPFEDHVSTWENAELERFGKVEVLNQDEVSAVLLITQANA